MGPGCVKTDLRRHRRRDCHTRRLSDCLSLSRSVVVEKALLNFRTLSSTPKAPVGPWGNVFSRQARLQAHIACISGATPRMRITRLRL